MSVQTSYEEQVMQAIDELEAKYDKEANQAEMLLVSGVRSGVPYAQEGLINLARRQAKIDALEEIRKRLKELLA